MDKNLLINIAKKSIEKKFDSKITIDKEILIKDFPILNEKRATFVTLKKDGELRGCIGTLVADNSLLEDLIKNSYMAAFLDPRFYELTPQEFENIELEISILSPAINLAYKDFDDLKNKLIPNKHGVILEFEGKRSTFLPQVWEQLPTFDQFFAHLCYKGGFEVDDDFKPKVYIYEVEKIK